MPSSPRRVMVGGKILRLRVLAAALVLSGMVAPRVHATDYATAVSQFQISVEEELSRGIISGVSVALVHDQEIVFAKGFGFADKKRRKPAQAGTIYRAGSIS